MKRLGEIADRALSSIEGLIVLGAIGMALLIGCAQVILRYVFNAGVHWSEAAFVLCTVTAMLFAGSRAVREDRHIRVDVLPRLLPRRGQLVLAFLADLVAGLLCAYFVYCGLRFVLFLNLMGTRSPETGLPDWIVYLLVPVTFGFFTIRYLQTLRRTARGELHDQHKLPAGEIGDGS